MNNIHNLFIILNAQNSSLTLLSSPFIPSLSSPSLISYMELELVG